MSRLIFAALVILLGAGPASAYNLDCRFWTHFADGQWAPTHTITIEVEGNRWVLGQNTTLVRSAEKSAVIDLAAALDQQCGQQTQGERR